MGSLRSDHFLNTNRLTMSQAARCLGVHVSTVWRWRLRGVRGVKLQTFVIGGTRYVLEDDLKAFLVAMNSDDRVLADDQVGRADKAAAQLNALGVKGGNDV